LGFLVDEVRRRRIARVWTVGRLVECAGSLPIFDAVGRLARWASGGDQDRLPLGEFIERCGKAVTSRDCLPSYGVNMALSILLLELGRVTRSWKAHVLRAKALQATTALRCY
jgi:hypothetical protein